MRWSYSQNAQLFISPFGWIGSFGSSERKHECGMRSIDTPWQEFFGVLTYLLHQN